jgi:hypothetical protein
MSIASYALLLSSNILVTVNGIGDLAPLMNSGVRIHKYKEDAVLFPLYFPTLTIVCPGGNLDPKPGEEDINTVRYWLKKNFKKIKIVDSFASIQAHLEKYGEAKTICGK